MLAERVHLHLVRNKWEHFHKSFILLANKVVFTHSHMACGTMVLVGRFYKSLCSTAGAVLRLMIVLQRDFYEFH